MCLGDILDLVLELDGRDKEGGVGWRRGGAKCKYSGGEVDYVLISMEAWGFANLGASE